MQKSDVNAVSRIIARTISGADSKKAKKDMKDQSNRLYAAGENFLACIGKKCIGVIGYYKLNHHPRKVAWLDWFAVNKSYQQKGVGSKLLLHMIKVLKRKKYKMLLCEMSSKGTAKRFYAKHKFRKFGQLKNYWEDGGDLILLVKEIK